MRLVVLVSLLVLTAPAAASARPGDNDPAFASHGRTAFRVGTASAQVGGLAVRPGGQALVAGTARVGDGSSGATSLSELDPGGRLHRSFGSGGTVLADPVRSAVVQPAGMALAPNGSAIVASTVMNPSTGHLEVHLVKVLPDGTLDAGFGANGVSVLDFLGGNVTGSDVAIDSAGRILVAASTERDGRRYASAFRLLPSGELDQRFAGGRVDLDSRAFAGAILPRPGGGVILAGGTLRSYGNVAVVEADDQGRRIDAFAGGRSNTRLTDRTRPGTGARDMVFGPNGTIVVAAAVLPKGARERMAVIRLNRRGRLDTSFARSGIFTAGTSARQLTVARMARDGRGRLLLAGAAHDPRTGAESALVLRLTGSGRPDRTFGSGGKVVRRLGGAAGTRFVDSRATAIAAARGRVWAAGIAYDDVVDPASDLGRAWPAVLRLLG